MIKVLCGAESSAELYALATVARSKGPDDEFAVMVVVRAIEEMGITSDLIIRTDKESSAYAVARRVATHRRPKRT
eukprot:15978418-Heterocapsa_arctica.AAC.1